MRQRGTKSIETLDDYLDFFQNPQLNLLTNKSLLQMIQMHGFMKIHHGLKKDLIDALKTIDLLSPFRSTLNESICSEAFLDTEEVMSDLASLQWKECSLQSIETLNPSINPKKNVSNDQDLVISVPALTEKLNGQDLVTSVPALTENLNGQDLQVFDPAVREKAKPKRKRKRKRRSVKELEEVQTNSSDFATANAVASYWLSLRL